MKLIDFLPKSFSFEEMEEISNEIAQLIPLSGNTGQDPCNGMGGSTEVMFEGAAFDEKGAIIKIYQVYIDNSENEGFLKVVVGFADSDFNSIERENAERDFSHKTDIEKIAKWCIRNIKKDKVFRFIDD